MMTSQSIWFVYRSPSEGPLGKRVRRLGAPSILAWFQARIEEARIALDPARCADVELGGPVLGFGAVLEAAKKLSLHTPKTTAALAKLLQEHLHVDGGSADVRVDAHAIRVTTHGEEGERAYFFFDDDALGRMGRNLAYLLHDEPRLPEGDAERPFAVAPVQALAPAGEKEGATYACLLTGRDRHLAGHAVVLPGVRLPELAEHLRRVTPAEEGPDAWPLELRALRTVLEAGDTQLAPALRRAAAHLEPEADPARVIVAESGHAALLARYSEARRGYEQWILFDDRWAAAQAELATSILHYTEQADPFTPLRAARPTSTAPKAKPASSADKKPRAASKPKAKADKASSKEEATWKAAVGDRDVATALGYRTTMRFDAGSLVTHAKFGVGVVTRAEGTKCEVLFRDGPRLLVHGASA
jgi:hypothetical protein